MIGKDPFLPCTAKLCLWNQGASLVVRLIEVRPPRGGVNLLCVGILARSPDPSRKIWLFSARGQGVHLLQSDGFYFPFHRFGWELDLIASQEDFSLAYGLPGRVLNCGESARVSACLAEIRTVPWCRRK